MQQFEKETVFEERGISYSSKTFSASVSLVPKKSIC